MKRDEEDRNRKGGIERRDVLRGLGLAAGGAAAALPLTGLAQEGTAETPATQVKQRYRETDHVKRFYALNRL